MQEESVYLVLGCHGRKEDGFSLCNSVQNRILKIDNYLVDIEGIWVYLEGVRLLDKPLLDLNAIRNLVFKMQDKFDQNLKKLWSEQEFHYIERFIHMHKICGLYVKLEISSQEQIDDVEPDNVVKISGIKELDGSVTPTIGKAKSRARR